MVVGELSDASLFLALMNLSGGKIRGRTRGQKTVYLLKRDYDLPFSFEFRPYYYGPYSDDLSLFLTNLEAVALIEEERIVTPGGFIRYDLRLTDHGQELANRIVAKLQEERPTLMVELKECVRELNDLSILDLVSRAKTPRQL